MITKPNIIKSRWGYCLTAVLITLAGVMALSGLAAAQSQSAAAQQSVNLASTRASNRYVAKIGLDTGACIDRLSPCATLQYAIDRAGTGDSILVAAGVYTDVNTYGGLAQVAYITKTIDLRGGYSPDFDDRDPEVFTTTLDAGGLGRVLFLAGRITPTVEGFVITHGDATGLGGLSTGEDVGGGIYVITATATISDCDIVNNYAYGGGGVNIVYSTGGILQNNFIKGNQAYMGSGVLAIESQSILRGNEIVENSVEAAGSVTIVSGSAIVDNNTVSRNINSNSMAGGVYCNNSTALITNNRITDNEAAGVWMDNRTTGPASIIQGNLINGNTLGFLCWNGCPHASLLDNQINDNELVGVYIIFNSYVTISGNTIHGNQSTSNGAGIYLFMANYGVITDNTIVENISQQDGGGIYIQDGSHFTISHNIITGNQTSRDGGGIHLVSSEDVTLLGNIISDNQAAQRGGGIFSSANAAKFASNLITQNNAGNYGGGLYIWYGAELTNNLVAMNNSGINGSGMYLYYNNYTLLHNTLADNRGGDGSGVFIGGNNTTINMVNTILVSQTAGIQVNSGVQATLDSTLWYSNTQNWAGSGTVTAINNYTGDPAFVAPASGDYHIQPTSTATDIGVNAGVYADFEADPRPVYGGFDLGFDEYLAKVDFTLHKQASPGRVEAGDPLIYVLSFANQGNLTATQVLITDILPVELEGYLVASTLPITSTGGIPYTWEVAPLAPGRAGVITITGFISSGLPGGYVFTNTAQITTTAPVNVIHRADDVAWAVVHTNASPVAVNDVYSMPEDTLLQVHAPGVVQNDHDPDGDVLSAILDNQPITGELSLQAEGGFTYLPPANYNGEITFTYHLSDGLADSNLALVEVNITPVNDLPLAVDDLAATLEDTPVAVAVLANDTDIDGDPVGLSAIGQPMYGSTTISGSLVVYTPAPEFAGQEVFTYTISDGHGGAAAALVTITVEAVNDAPIVNAGEDQAALEAGTIFFNGSFIDDETYSGNHETFAAGEQIFWDFGDGFTASGTLTPTHAYGDNGIFTTTLTITDSDTAAGQDWLLVTVGNVAPLLSALPDQVIQIGQLLTVTGVFTDPGWLDTHELIIEWEMGITETVSITPGERQFELEHGYTQAGTFTVTVWITDDDGGMDRRSFEIEITPWRVYLPVMRK